MGRYTGKACRLLCMMSLTTSFFFVEITVGFIINSLALIGDSYHMLSDIVALGVGFASVRISKWKSPRNTYGWARAEVLGALINSVFLVALCFSIFVEALNRLVGDHHIHNPDMMLIVGGIGLAINVAGLFLLHGHAHGHSHGSHGHSHGSHSHSHGSDTHANHVHENHKNDETNAQLESLVTDKDVDEASDSPQIECDTIEDIEKSAVKSSAQLNMRAVFLHVLGDALGSVIVMISALVIKFVKHDWAHKIDPMMSIVLVIIILATTIPLLKESAFILLQTVPYHISVEGLKQKLLTKVDGVLAVHDLHIWQLAGNCLIASVHVHINCQSVERYMEISEKVKKIFHSEGIHSTTVQAEIVDETSEKLIESSACLLECCATHLHENGTSKEIGTKINV